MIEQRNLVLAIALSIGILILFQVLFERPQPPVEPAPQGAPALPAPTATAPGASGIPAVPGVGVPAPDRSAAVNAGARLRIDSPALHGSIALVGGRVDDLTLASYHENPNPASPEIVLLSPPGAPHPYYAEFGWVPVEAGTPVPGPDTPWTADSEVLRPGKPVTLSWDNGRGLRFQRTYGLDQHYMFTVSQRVENYGEAPVALHPYSLVSRTGTPETMGFFILHEGPLGVFDNTLKELDYSDLQGQPPVQATSTGGWIGITDKYWLTALVPPQDKNITARFSHRQAEGVDKYQVDYLGEAVTVAPGAAADSQGMLFAGAKRVELLDGYSEQYGIQRFDLAIDFGWFYFITKPFFYGLQIIHSFVGNFGVAILILTVVIKAAFFPLANKSYRAMSKMKKLQPEVKKLQERFGDDKMRLNQELMALYKREKANPVAGCLPIVIQIPVFFALYKVLFVTIEMRHAPFFGWIKDLSAPDPTTLFNLFGLVPWDPPAFLMIGVWPLIMGITMFLQQRLNPQPTDPVQAKMFLFLPVIFTFLLANFPAGLVIYWAWSNSLSILQQWIIMRQMGVKP